MFSSRNRKKNNFRTSEKPTTMINSDFLSSEYKENLY